METIMPHEEFERKNREMPEPKLELLDGRLSVGNGAGNLQLLRHLLEGWGAEAALPMAPSELWWEALHQGFRQFDPPSADKAAQVWHSWAAQLCYESHLPPAGPMVDGKHRAARDTLITSLFGLARAHGFAYVSGRDVIMRLGEDAFTPDVFAVGPGRSRLVNEHYLDGPADLVIEVLLPGHEAYDREVKRRRYGPGGVPEFWLVDPVKRSVELLRWTGQEYRPSLVNSDDKYRSRSFPGLSFHPKKLWQGKDVWTPGPNPFALEAPFTSIKRGFEEGGVAWGDLAFHPQPDLAPRRLSFEEFAAWAPEAKFELIDGKPWVGGSRGSRNVLGLLLRTEGLVKAVTVLHPRHWVAALVQAKEQRVAEGARREHWWEIARQAAELLRQEFGFGRLVVIGDLVRPQPLNLWSMITFVALDCPDNRDTWDASRLLYERFRDEPDVNLIKHQHATRSEKDAVATEGVDL
jgi:Uma2 family endonuclease